MGSSAPSPTLTWSALSTVYYSSHQLYSLSWPIRTLPPYHIVPSPTGSALAVYRNPSALLSLPAYSAASSAPTKSLIQVYSASGNPLASITPPSQPVKVGFTAEERVVVVLDVGTYRVYDFQGASRTHGLGTEASEQGVLDARIWEGGMVVLTKGLQLVEVRGWDGANTRLLANPELSETPHDWALIPSTHTSTSLTTVLLSTDSTILSVDSLSSTDQHPSHGPFSHVRPSPNGRFAALLTVSGLLWVVSSDFSRELSSLDTASIDGVSGSPAQVEWCGNNAVVLAWEGDEHAGLPGRAVVVGPGETLSYTYSASPRLLPTPTALLVLTPTALEFLTKVPDATHAVFAPGSTDPAALLLDAYEHFERGSPKADEGARAIGGDLASAVDGCVQAAGEAWDVTWQRTLLKAARFGWGFLDLYNPSEYVSTAQTLRVLNALRDHTVGIPLTLPTYALLPPSSLLALLLSRALHLLALRVSAHLGLRPDGVLKHWACAKIAAAPAGRTDEDVRDEIVRRLEGVEGAGGAGWAEVARKAWESGRTGLATLLLDHEPRAADQVPLLLSMKQDRLALLKAIDSGDTDLVYHVLLHLRAHLPLGDFFRLLETGGAALAPASALLQVYAREQDREMLRDYYYQDDRRVESAVLELEEARAAEDIVDKLQKIKAASKFFSEDKEHAFEAKMADDYHRLLAFQSAPDVPVGRALTGLSLNDTLRVLLVGGQAKRAEKLRSEFKVSDKRWWYVKIKALVEARDWEGLETFAKSKKSPIGYEPFVHALLAADHKHQASLFVPRCDAKARVDLYVRCGEWSKAAQEGKDQKDRGRLELLQKQSPNSIVQREIAGVLNSLGS